MGWGGKRRGAGRPKLRKLERRVTICVRVPADVKEWLDKQEQSLTELTETAIIQYYGLREGDDFEEEVFY